MDSIVINFSDGVKRINLDMGVFVDKQKKSYI